jgi:hypothetical protein
LPPHIAAGIFESVIQGLRERIARLLAAFVFIVTFGQVHVNRTGNATTSEARGTNAPISSKLDLQQNRIDRLNR